MMMLSASGLYYTNTMHFKTAASIRLTVQTLNFTKTIL